jgi:hypothetical protein
MHLRRLKTWMAGTSPAMTAEHFLPLTPAKAGVQGSNTLTQSFGPGFPLARE